MEKSHASVRAFLHVSAWLTGFEEVELQGTGMVDTYYDLAAASNPNAFESLLAEWHLLVLRADGDAFVLSQLIGSRLMPATNYDALAQKIIAVWYSGIWYTDVSNLNSGTTVNGNAYQQGLMWDVAEAHPPGAKQPGFGSWANPPIRIPAR